MRDGGPLILWCVCMFGSETLWVWFSFSFTLLWSGVGSGIWSSVRCVEGTRLQSLIGIISLIDRSMSSQSYTMKTLKGCEQISLSTFVAYKKSHFQNFWVVQRNQRYCGPSIAGTIIYQMKMRTDNCCIILWLKLSCERNGCRFGFVQCSRKKVSFFGDLCSAFRRNCLQIVCFLLQNKHYV